MARGKVFVVDDDASVRKSLCRLIRAGGYEVEALEHAGLYLLCSAPIPPVCMLLDIRMPDINGLELQEIIAGTARDLPVVFITGHGDDDIRARALSAGAVDVLFKPLDEGVLFEAIDRALGHPARSS